MTPDLAALARDLATRLTERPSVTATEDEAAFGPWLADLLRALPHWPGAEVWTVPVAPGDPRLCVALLVRGTGRATVLLTGHYDTVTVADYGDLAPLATRPGPLAEALQPRLAGAEPGTAAARARDDLAAGWMFGRGLLDMKAGLAAGLAAMAAFAADPEANGNLLFLAVPDEENASAGARAGAAALAALAADRGLDVGAAINLDAIADDGDGSAGRVVALGTVGKVLPTLLVVGAPVHSGFPLRGLNAAVLAAAVAARLEWAPELTDEGAEEAGTPVSLLALRDGKGAYDVTTPGTAWAAWSVLSHRRDPSTVLDAVETLAREALAGCLADLRDRAGRSGQPAGAVLGLADLPVLRLGAVLAAARARDPGFDGALDAEARRLRDAGVSLPDAAQRLTETVWRASGLAGPAAVLGLGSVPYPATEVADDALRAAVAALVAGSSSRHGVGLATAAFFAGISDVSYWGQADAAALTRLAADTPGWDAFVGPLTLAQVPTVNLGPWGRDYHTPLERIEPDYAFRALPALVLDLARQVLGSA